MTNSLLYWFSCHTERSEVSTNSRRALNFFGFFANAQNDSSVDFLLRLVPCNPLGRSFHSPSMTRQGVSMTNLGLANGFWFALRNVCRFEPLQKATERFARRKPQQKNPQKPSLKRLGAFTQVTPSFLSLWEKTHKKPLLEVRKKHFKQGFSPCPWLITSFKSSFFFFFFFF